MRPNSAKILHHCGRSSLQWNWCAHWCAQSEARNRDSCVWASIWFLIIECFTKEGLHFNCYLWENNKVQIILSFPIAWDGGMLWLTFSDVTTAEQAPIPDAGRFPFSLPCPPPPLLAIFFFSKFLWRRNTNRATTRQPSFTHREKGTVGGSGKGKRVYVVQPVLFVSQCYEHCVDTL